MDLVFMGGVSLFEAQHLMPPPRMWPNKDSPNRVVVPFSISNVVAAAIGRRDLSSRDSSGLMATMTRPLGVIPLASHAVRTIRHHTATAAHPPRQLICIVRTELLLSG